MIRDSKPWSPTRKRRLGTQPNRDPFDSTALWRPQIDADVGSGPSAASFLDLGAQAALLVGKPGRSFTRVPAAASRNELTFGPGRGMVEPVLITA
jgi:hypothetical protein